MVKLKFWGVRGSLPTPGYKYVKYGGNTSCIELRFDDELVMLDAGTGARNFGNALAKEFGEKKKPIKASIFISHTHWDHIHGFPFFTPIYIPGTTLNIYGGHSVTSLEDLMTDQMRREYFPVTLFELAADITFNSLEQEPPLMLNENLAVYWMPLFHPGMCFGYRFVYKDKIVVYATDTELFQEPGLAEVNLKSIESFIKDADVLIYDTQYTLKEYLLNRVGWGHSAIEEVIDVCLRTNVKHLFGFHHDPNHDDDFMDKMITRVNIHQDQGLFVSAAREGLEVIL